MTGTIAICGNPNCGKTTIFNAITGLKQKVANYPGVTVEKITGEFSPSHDRSRRFTLIDVPGSYSLAAFSPDEAIATEVLSGGADGTQRPDAIIAVIDATNLERSLYFLFQVLQMGRPTVVALNMTDIAARNGITIDYKRMSQLLGGIKVLPVVGNRGVGVKELKDAAVEAVGQAPTPALNAYGIETEELLQNLIDSFGNTTRTKAEYVRAIFDVDGPVEQRFITQRGPDAREAILSARAQIQKQFGALSTGETGPLTTRAEEIASAVITHSDPHRRSWSERIDRYLLHPFFGPAILFAVMIIMFQAIFTWAEPFMNFIDTSFGGLASIVEGQLSAGPLRSLIVDGIIGGVGSVLVFIPQIIILFLFISFLEDTGYMARAAFLVDRLFRWCGLSGKSFIPMLSSYACAVPGILATRTIEDRKLRIMTIMLAPLMTCSARLPVYTIMIAAFSPFQTIFGPINLQGMVLTLLYMLGLVVAVAVSFILKKTMLRAEAGTFIMEMPSYKLPTMQSIVVRVLNRVKSFIVRAGTVIFAITVIIWALSYYPRDEAAQANLQQQVEILDSQLQNDLAAGSNATALNAEYADAVSQLENQTAGQNLRNSYFGRAGRVLEPIFRPLGWDWKITMAVLASFPAREVIIATLGTIYNLGADEDEESSTLVDKMRNATWESGPKAGEAVFTPAVALSIMVFFALCCQCGATVVTIKQEAGHWGYAVGVFVYMTALAYVLGLATFQLFHGLGM